MPTTPVRLLVPSILTIVVGLIVVFAPRPAVQAQTSVTTFALTVSTCGSLGSTVYNVNTNVPLTVDNNGKVCER